MSLPGRIAALRLQRYLITGALTLLPLWLTYIVFKFVFALLSSVSAPWIAAVAAPLAQAFPLAFGWLDAPWVQSAIAVFVTVLLIYLVGWATHRVVGQRLIAAFERGVARIPMVQTIYGGTKKLLELMQTKPDGTHRVVLIEFPNAEMKTVGLVTRTLRDADTGREYAAVYVPTTPNPTSGYLEIVPLDRVTPTDWTMDQAMAFIISGGAIAPARFRFGAAPAIPSAPNDKD
jgi:uncharacterized membrane protein